MAFHISELKTWQAGVGTPAKYTVQFELDCELLSIVDMVATFQLSGTVAVTNYPTQSQNSWPASDFAVLTLGGFDPINYPFTEGTSYYQAALPALPNAPQSYLNAMQVEFRGDTYRGAGANRVSLWVNGRGTVVNANSAAGTTTQAINHTFTLQLTGDPYQEVLIYTHSGARNSTGYDWLKHDVWATLFSFDYRPGATYINGTWQSHNRTNGLCQEWTGSSWTEMRTEGYPTAQGNPPLIYRNGAWYNQAEIGDE